MQSLAMIFLLFPPRLDLWPYRAAYLVVWVNETAETVDWPDDFQARAENQSLRMISRFVKLSNYFVYSFYYTL